VREVAVFFTSPLRGEVGRRPGEGAHRLAITYFTVRPSVSFGEKCHEMLE
jgi:hypothetical protein